MRAVLIIAIALFAVSAQAGDPPKKQERRSQTIYQSDSAKVPNKPLETTTVNTSKSNNLREAAPGGTTAPNKPLETTTINTTKSNSYREAGSGQATGKTGSVPETDFRTR